MSKKFFALALALLTTNVLADFCPCPGSFNLIKIGDPLEQILKTCCAPSSKKTYPKPTKVPYEWVYNITPPSNPGDSVQASVRMTVDFDTSDKATNITVGAQSTASTSCSTTPQPYFSTSLPNTIQVGNTADQIKAACGKPLFKNPPDETQVAADPNTPSSEITELNYAGPPPVTLLFTDGLLSEIQKTGGQ